MTIELKELSGSEMFGKKPEGVQTTVHPTSGDYGLSCLNLFFAANKDSFKSPDYANKDAGSVGKE